MKKAKPETGLQFRNEYWLASEQRQFCRENGISSWGNKETVANRIVVFLDTGERLTPKQPRTKGPLDSDKFIKDSTRLPRSAPPIIFDLGGGEARLDFQLITLWFSIYCLSTERGAPPQLIMQ